MQGTDCHDVHRMSQSWAPAHRVRPLSSLTAGHHHSHSLRDDLVREAFLACQRIYTIFGERRCNDRSLLGRGENGAGECVGFHCDVRICRDNVALTQLRTTQQKESYIQQSLM